jgi:hypothetical protein
MSQKMDLALNRDSKGGLILPDGTKVPKDKLKPSKGGAEDFHPLPAGR